MWYITNTFSPMMLTPNQGEAVVKEIGLNDVLRLYSQHECRSAIGHEVTAKIVSALLGDSIEFNRVNLSLELGDRVLCVIPNFRATEAREFTFDEVSNAGYRCFTVEVGG